LPQRFQGLFHQQVEPAADRVVQAAAMRRVGAEYAALGRRKPRQRTALGAMAVDDFGAARCDAPRHMPHGGEIGRMRVAADRNAGEAERQLGRKLRKGRIGKMIAGRTVGDDTDFMAALDLAAGKIDDMAEQAADRRTQDVKNLHS
jgi:hypothetical protein